MIGMSESNISYTFKYGGTKINVDIGSSLRPGAKELTANKNRIAAHYHAKHELFFVGSEPLIVEEGGTRHTFTDCIVCIPPFCRHKTERQLDRRILFSFTTKEDRPTDFSRFLESFFSSRSIFSFSTNRGLSAYLDELEDLIAMDNDMSDDTATAVLKLLFYNIFTSNSSGSSASSGARESYLIIIERIINNYSLNPAVTVTLETVANELHLGKRQTARIIYKYFGRSLSELVSERRLTVAASLLLSTNDSISDIAATANFHSENYFFKQFKEAFGMTPLAYRRCGGYPIRFGEQKSKE